MAFVCAGCGSQIGSKSNYTRHLKRCARALEIEEDYILTPLPGLDELDREIWPSSDSPSFSPSVTTPSPSSSRKRGRPTKPLSQQSPRTEQNKKARFAKEVREVEKKHERSVSDLPAQAASSTLTSKIVDIYQNLPPRSPLRQGLLHGLCEGEDVQVMEEMFDVSTQTIKQAQNLDENKNPFIQLKYAVGVTRQKVTPDQKKAIEDYWFSSTCPVPWKQDVSFEGKKD